MSANPKPCPFCGSKDIGYEYINTYSSDSSYNTFGCRDCGVRFECDDASSKAEDLKAWNTRTYRKGD
jgi:Lar family restriction alleviation protein